MNKVYSYIRFSGPRQAEGDSHRLWLADILAYCQKHNLELVSDSDYMFFDRGISAYSGKLCDDNTELSRFLALIQAKEIPASSTLIVESLDRLSREHVRQAISRFKDLLNAGITIHTQNGNKTYHAYDYDQFDLFQSIMEMSCAHSKSEIQVQAS
jgi:DNA invertase Pin-like site-specific DNA recombinase